MYPVNNAGRNHVGALYHCSCLSVLSPSMFDIIEYLPYKTPKSVSEVMCSVNDITPINRILIKKYGIINFMNLILSEKFVVVVYPEQIKKMGIKNKLDQYISDGNTVWLISTRTKAIALAISINDNLLFAIAI